MAEEQGWVRIASKGDLAEGEVIGRKLGDREIAIYQLEDGEYRATDNVCTHEYALLSDGFVEGGLIECPLHAGQFDIRSGKAMCAPVNVDLQVFELRVSGDDLLIRKPA